MGLGWKYNFVERHGHKLMTASNRFKFSGARRGLRSIFARTKREEGMSMALYEFAMVLPVLSMLIVGTIYGGITFYDYEMLDYAVAIGAKTVANNRAVGSATPNACTLGENALTKAAYNLTGVITINNGPGTETFVGKSTCTALTQGDTVTMTATYPCNLTIPFSGINLCPVQTSSVNTNVPSGSNLASTPTGSCPSKSCIAATVTVRIE
jgi:Flp pilus assembly protein TadG